MGEYAHVRHVDISLPLIYRPDLKKSLGDSSEIWLQRPENITQGANAEADQSGTGGTIKSKSQGERAA